MPTLPNVGPTFVCYLGLKKILNIDQNQVLFAVKNECCYNVVEMFSCNVLVTFLEYVAVIEFVNVFITFPQRGGNVAATIYC